MKVFKKLKQFRWGYLLLALFLIALGVAFFLGRPEGSDTDTLHYMAIGVGALTILYAGIFAFFTLLGNRNGVLFGFKMAFVIIVLIAGCLALIMRESTVAVIVNVLSLILVVDGSFKLNTAVLCRRYVVVGWWLILMLSFVMISGGFFLLLTAGGLEGIKQGTVPPDVYYPLAALLCVEGIANFLTAFYLGGYEKHMRKSLYEELCAEADEEEAEREAAERAAEEKARARAERARARKERRAAFKRFFRFSRKKPETARAKKEKRAPFKWFSRFSRKKPETALVPVTEETLPDEGNPPVKTDETPVDDGNLPVKAEGTLPKSPEDTPKDE